MPLVPFLKQTVFAYASMFFITASAQSSGSGVKVRRVWSLVLDLLLTNGMSLSKALNLRSDASSISWLIITARLWGLSKGQNEIKPKKILCKWRCSVQIYIIIVKQAVSKSSMFWNAMSPEKWRPRVVRPEQNNNRRGPIWPEAFWVLILALCPIP